MDTLKKVYGNDKIYYEYLNCMNVCLLSNKTKNLYLNTILFFEAYWMSLKFTNHWLQVVRP